MSVRQLPVEVRDGRECVLIPIGKKGQKGSCVGHKASWQLFLDLGFAANTTFTLKSGAVYFYDGKASICLARIFKQAADDEEIVYHNGDKLDLRLDNLGTKPRRGKAKAAPVDKVAKREPWKVNPWAIGGDVVDQEGPEYVPAVGGGVVPEKLLAGGQVNHINPKALRDEADRYFAELDRVYRLRASDKGLLVPKRGKTWKQFKAPQYKVDFYRWGEPKGG